MAVAKASTLGFLEGMRAGSQWHLTSTESLFVVMRLSATCRSQMKGVRLPQCNQPIDSEEYRWQNMVNRRPQNGKIVDNQNCSIGPSSKHKTYITILIKNELISQNFFTSIVFLFGCCPKICCNLCNRETRADTEALQET